jgi:hypothetical protein
MQRPRRQGRVFESVKRLEFSAHSAKLGTASCTGTSRFSISGNDKA